MNGVAIEPVDRRSEPRRGYAAPAAPRPRRTRSLTVILIDARS